nr:putative reverse transcriptase domain-containing protein [Tanacetum cinerariifolium]
MIDQGVNTALAARDANRTGDDSHTSGTGVRRTERWFERMETVFRISNYLAENQIKFATCTLLAEFKKKIAYKYCPRNEMKKIETEFWNLEVQGTDVTMYNQRFQELALLCVRMSPTNANVANNLRGNRASQKVTCYECGAQGHFKRYCPKLKNNNNNRGNQVGTGNAQARVYAVGNAKTNPDANTVTDGKSKKKRLENVPIVRDFPEVFPEDLPVLPLTRQVNKKEHEEHLRTILKLLKKEELYAKFSKCEFLIPKKKIKFEWGDKQEAAFQLLKQKLCSAPILALPEGSEDFVAYCDASIKGLGAVLMQRDKLISYASLQLKIH